MIPADVASRLRLVTPDLPAPTLPVQSAQKLTDILSDFGVGQRIMAEIQALLPNGTYRAVVGQRDVTLALPFSAKPGDTLELEVKENDGQLTLALVKHNTASAAATTETDHSVATKLSSAGQLIGDLLGEVEQQGGKAKPAPLNANQPLFTGTPPKGVDLAPMLKQALSESGMFYESHQAKWVEGKLPTTALLLEPQGKLSQPITQPNTAASLVFTDQALATTGGPLPGTPGTLSTLAQATWTEGLPNHPVPLAANGDIDTLMQTTSLASSPQESHPNTESAHQPGPLSPTQDAQQGSTTSRTLGEPQQNPGSLTTTTTPTTPSAHPVAPELTSLVQQQLGALASQTYVWQGQAWPGQDMHWEISEDEGRKRTAGPNGDGPQWQTRLRLNLPSLGNVEAHLRLGQGGRLDLSLTTGNDQSRASLLNSAVDLQQQMAASGLSLQGFTVAVADATPNAATKDAP